MYDNMLDRIVILEVYSPPVTLHFSCMCTGVTEIVLVVHPGSKTYGGVFQIRWIGHLLDFVLVKQKLCA